MSDDEESLDEEEEEVEKVEKVETKPVSQKNT